MREVQGTARLVTHTPDPVYTVARGAWLCYHSQADIPIDISGEEIEIFVRRLKKMGHTSTFEHAVFGFDIEGVSRAFSHQLVRHRIASYNQQSQRYVEFDADDMSVIVPQSVKDVGFEEEYLGFMQAAALMYKSLITVGVPAEDARMVAPNGVETKVYTTMNARALDNFFNERLCRRAQWEIRNIAHQMLKQAHAVAPALFDGCGPDCLQAGGCQQGKMSCGRPYKSFEELLEG